jgi:hypothetical protein
MTTRQTDNPQVTQVTNVEQDERFYVRRRADGGLDYAPSWTHVLGETWPRSIGLEQWRGDVGNKRADEIMEQAGEEGSFVHAAVEEILKGGYIAASVVRETFPRGRALKPLRCLAAFIEFATLFDLQPEALESVTWLSLEDGTSVAGTVDFLGTMILPEKSGRSLAPNKEARRGRAILDWKSSKSIHDQHYAQIAGYTTSVVAEQRGPIAFGGIVHLGNATQRRWTLHDVTADFGAWSDKALTAVQTYHMHHPGARPSEEQFPAVFALPGASIEDAAEAAG